MMKKGFRMKGKTLKTLLFLTAAVMISALSLTAVYAGSAKVAVNTKETVKVNQVFTVYVKYSGTDLGTVSSVLKYDPDVLKHVSGGEEAGSTAVTLKNNIGGEDSFSFAVKFRAKKQGSTGLDVSTDSISDMQGQSLGTPVAYKTVDVSGVLKETAGAGDHSSREITRVLMISIAVTAVLLLIAIAIQNRKN